MLSCRSVSLSRWIASCTTQNCSQFSRNFHFCISSTSSPSSTTTHHPILHYPSSLPINYIRLFHQTTIRRSKNQHSSQTTNQNSHNENSEHQTIHTNTTTQTDKTKTRRRGKGKSKKTEEIAEMTVNRGPLESSKEGRTDYKSQLSNLLTPTQLTHLYVSYAMWKSLQLPPGMSVEKYMKELIKDKQYRENAKHKRQQRTKEQEQQNDVQNDDTTPNTEITTIFQASDSTTSSISDSTSTTDSSSSTSSDLSSQLDPEYFERRCYEARTRHFFSTVADNIFGPLSSELLFPLRVHLPHLTADDFQQTRKLNPEGPQHKYVAFWTGQQEAKAVTTKQEDEEKKQQEEPQLDQQPVTTTTTEQQSSITPATSNSTSKTVC